MRLNRRDTKGLLPPPGTESSALQRWRAFWGLFGAVSVLSTLGAGCGGGELAARPPDKVFGECGLGPGQFVYPRALAIGPEGCVFVVDKSVPARIQRFSPDGEFETLWRMPISDAGKPTGLTVDAAGRVLVADTHYHRVLIFDREGRELGRFGSYGEQPGQFIYPTDVAVDRDGYVYVSEYGGNDRITKFTPDFKPVLTMGGPGSGEASLLRPQAMAFDAQGILYVADACHHRICRFDTDGTFLGSFGRAGRQPGQFRYPYDLAFCPDGTLMVCEFGNARVQHFDRQGRLLGTWGMPGHDPGELAYPWGVAVGPNGHMYVLDSGNNRVQVVALE